MDEEEQLQKIEELEKKIDAIWVSVEKTRKYFLVVMWVTLAVIVLPSIALLFVIPAFLDSYLGSFEGLL